MEQKEKEELNKKEKLVKRLNRAFDLNITDNAIIVTRMNNRHGGFSWVISYGCSNNIGSTESITEVLKWKRWVLALELGELFEYCESGSYSKSDLIEKEK